MSDSTTFESLELEAHLLDRLDALGYEFATPFRPWQYRQRLQVVTFSPLHAQELERRQPSFSLFYKHTNQASLSVLPGTRLAVVNEIERLSGLDNIATALIGGASMKKQIQQLTEWPDRHLGRHTWSYL